MLFTQLELHSQNNFDQREILDRQFAEHGEWYTGIVSG